MAGLTRLEKLSIRNREESPSLISSVQLISCINYEASGPTASVKSVHRALLARGSVSKLVVLDYHDHVSVPQLWSFKSLGPKRLGMSMPMLSWLRAKVSS